MSTAYIALGSNCGDRSALLREAIDRLGNIAGIHVGALSRFYVTPAVGGPAGQGDYLNAAARLETALSAADLLAALHEVETALGRLREVRWGPRTIDLDVLLYEHLIINETELQLPHPRMHYRRFVLKPLAEIAGTVEHPAMRWSISELLDHVERRPHYLALALPDHERESLAAQLEQATGRPYVRLRPAPNGGADGTRQPWEHPVEWMRNADILPRTIGLATDRWTAGDWAGLGWMRSADAFAESDREICRAAWRRLQSPAKAPTLLVLCAEDQDHGGVSSLWRRWRLDGLQPRPVAPIVAISRPDQALQEALAAMQAAAAPCESL